MDGPAGAAAGLAIAALGALAGCGDDAPSPMSCPVGDRTQPIELAIMVSDGVTLHDFTDGDPVPLRRPLQGGQAIMIGVRATNVDGCKVNLTTTLRDPDDDRSLGLDVRPVTLVPSADGWARPAEPFFQSIGSTPACPNLVADRDIFGSPWKVELRLDEDGGRSATVFATVVPYCDEQSPKDECECECDADYVLGAACPLVDAGTDAGDAPPIDAG
ncbi:MAG TPA: hypothetical protein VHE35_17610, partial [Kofleriaceae bacterium]|nr:hypothetical protein [Kofleriaceae bacterium]